MSDHHDIIDAALAEWAGRDRAAALRLFVPEARGRHASARIALGHALRESAWLGSDAMVRDAKSAWWLEELALSARGDARHPLTRFLSASPAKPDFAQLSRAFSLLPSVTVGIDAPDPPTALCDLERALWFGAGPVDAAACATRARAAWIDVLERRGALSGGEGEAGRAALAVPLLDAPAMDPWTAARRAQSLRWLGARSGRAFDPAWLARWREVWSVWNAVRKARWIGGTGQQTGERRGT